MSIMKSPFNFVPISDKVAIADWAGLVSHDIPFSDGECGSIEITIENETPLFISDGKKKKDNSPEVLRFSQTPDGRYFIPGSSLKGEIRNILETLSFGKARLDASAAFARRTLRDKDIYPLMNKQKDIRCGYLYYDKVKNTYVIEDHDKPYRIGHDEIENYIESIDSSRRRILSKHFCKSPETRGCSVQSFNLNNTTKLNSKDFDPKTASFKYELLKGIKLEGLNFDISENSTEQSTRLKYDPYGEITGDIVLTGQPSQWEWPRPKKQGGGKFYEFVFPSSISTRLRSDGLFTISEEQFNHYKFIYSESDEWKRCKDQLNKEGIPVFFIANKTGVEHLGFAYLYKLPYDKTPSELLSEQHRKGQEHDLAETIFGYTTKEESLKGRVQFSHLFTDNANELPQITLTLNGPKASYYPMYIKQNGGGYNTYDNGELAGRKRYIVRNSVWAKSTSEKLDTTFIPLEKGAKFKGRVYFHNLRTVEIGALLSALTFHKTDCCRHQLGMAKPYGYGRVKISVNTDGLEKEEGYYLAQFEKFMLGVVPGWSKCQEITELLSLATPVKDSQTEQFGYMDLSVNPNKNEFEDAKNKNEYLKSHTQITGNKIELCSIYDRYKEAEEKQLQEDIVRDVYRADELEKDGLIDEAISINRDIQKKYNISRDEDIRRLSNIQAQKRYNEATLKMQAKEYEQALELFRQAETYGITCSLEMNDCKEKLEKQGRGLADGFVLGSIAACATKIKKSENPSDEDLQKLAFAIKEQLPGKNKSDQRTWLDFGKWKPIKDIIGNERAQMMFNIVQGKK